MVSSLVDVDVGAMNKELVAVDAVKSPAIVEAPLHLALLALGGANCALVDFVDGEINHDEANAGFARAHAHARSAFALERR